MDALPQEVLVVDHAPSFRELLEIFLADEGYDVVDASLDEHSVDQVLALQPALYVVGLKPGASQDLALLQRLRQQPQRPPVLVLSTTPQLLEMVRSRPGKYAGDRFLVLPVDLDDLLQAVRDMIGPV